MKIVVCLKWIISTDSHIRVEGDAIEKRGIFHVVNPYDMVAVEQAVRLKELFGESEVILVCLGPSSTGSGIRQCLAMGADRGIIIVDNALESIDAHGTALVLAETIRLLNYDLIICGQESADKENAQVGTLIANALNLPLVSAVVGLDVYSENSRLIAHRKLLKGNREIVETRLPALVTVEIGLAKPRYPALRAVLAAEKKEVKECNLQMLGLKLEEVTARSYKTSILAHSNPRPKPKRLFTPDSSLSAAERIRLVMSGGVTKKHGNLLEGNADYITTNVIRFLREQKMLSDK